jgi:hypothetical protein
VASNGLIEKVRTNLVLQSEAFNTTWAVNGIVVTANSAANPLTGTTTADTITADAANNFHLITQSITYSANENTVSIYVKANGYSWFLIDPSITNAFGYFNVTTGAVGTKGSACTTSISNVGGGWYRCSVTFTPSAGAAICNFSIRDADNGGAFLGDGVSGFFIFGAQAETGVATDYIPTTTAAVSVGPVSGLPRLDYLGSTCPRLLLEPQRTNVATYSEQFDNAAWSKTKATVTANDTISPDGYTNADKIVFADGTSTINQAYNLAGATATRSVYIKGTAGQTISLDDVFASQPLITLTGQWQRITFTAAAPNGYGFGISTFGGATARTIWLWGAQTEVGAYATSYIPTLGTSVTRVADAASKTGISSLIGQQEGVVFLDFVYNGSEAQAGNLFNTNTNTTSSLFIVRTATGIIDAGLFVSGSTAAKINLGSIPVGSRVKLAYAYKSGSSALYVNGVQIGTSANTYTLPSAMTEINLNDDTSYFAFQQSVSFNQTLLFTTRLTNESLAELTSL